MTGKVSITGLPELVRKVDGKFRRLQQKILREALTAFAEPIRQNAEQLARTLISPRIEVVTRVKMRGTGGTVVVGPSTKVFEVKKNGRSITSANVAYWFEFGYDIRSKPKGPSLKHVGARPSLTPAYAANKERALQIFEDTLRNALEAEAA